MRRGRRRRRRRDRVVDSTRSCDVAAAAAGGDVDSSSTRRTSAVRMLRAPDRKCSEPTDARATPTTKRCDERPTNYRHQQQQHSSHLISLLV